MPESGPTRTDPNRSPRTASNDAGGDFERLLGLMVSLRDPERGCPWTRAQTFETIAPYTVEEAYEVVDAIRAGDLRALCDELGDLLLQVVYHARMAEEAGAFDATDVIGALADKLVRRHPHVFAQGSAADSAEVVRNWERIKASERPDSSAGKSILDRVMRSAPALVRARKLQEAVERAQPAAPGFASNSVEALRREITRLSEGALSPDGSRQAVGEALFALVRLSRAESVDPEAALDEANARFRERVYAVETDLQRAGRGLEDASPEQFAAIWGSPPP